MSSPPTAPRSSLRADLITAYLASGSKVASWAIVSALLFRVNEGDYAMFALVRATLGLLNYTSLGLAPAMIRSISQAMKRSQPVPVIAVAENESNILHYQAPSALRRRPVNGIFANGIAVAIATALFALLLTFVYSTQFNDWHRHPIRLEQIMPKVVLYMGIGIALRLASDVFGSVLQAHDRISADNRLLLLAEIIWVVAIFPAASFDSANDKSVIWSVAVAYMVSSLFLLVSRISTVSRHEPDIRPDWSSIQWKAAASLLGYGALIAVAQLADFLYAPTDFILINHFLGALDVAIYAPAVQIDSAMLVIVTGLAAVLLPKTAIAHAHGNHATIKSYYLRGTGYSFLMLAAGSIFIALCSKWILKIWLGDPSPATQAILPLVLIHTVVGGSSAVGRSILLGMGKVKPFTASVLIAGASNVLLSFIFVRYFNLGLKGIVFGTICAVVGRCAIWMPWYVLRTLRREQSSLEVTRAMPLETPPTFI